MRFAESLFRSFLSGVEITIYISFGIGTVIAGMGMAILQKMFMICGVGRLWSNPMTKKQGRVCRCKRRRLFLDYDILEGWLIIGAVCDLHFCPWCGRPLPKRRKVRQQEGAGG